MSRTDDIAAGLAEVRARIEAARVAAGRQDHVTLVVVTKTFPASDVRILADLGVVDVAENRDQEARAKREDVGSAGTGLRWHMIGQVQGKKAGSVSRWADVVESVDRLDLVGRLGRAARESGRELQALVQVSLDPEERPERGGIEPRNAHSLADAIAAEEGLRLAGVMGVAPFPGDPDEAFGRLREVAARIRAAHPAATVISAGMSDDLEQAVAHGATQVRIGGAVLGSRPPVQ